MQSNIDIHYEQQLSNPSEYGDQIDHTTGTTQHVNGGSEADRTYQDSQSPSPDFLEARDFDNEFDDSDQDSAIEDDSQSLWTSLKSETRNFRFENGRRYHAYREGRYFHPNDEQESNREEMKHHATLLLFKGSLHHAPIGSHPQRILDVGTGTGIWAMDIADSYPSAEVIGVDLSPIQPLMTPPNLMFEIDDIESDWLFPENIFDLVHIRYMFSALRDWPRILTQAHTAIRHNGWIEITEMDIIPTSDDGTVTEDYKLTEYFDILKHAAIGRGFNLKVAPDLSRLVTEAGYVNVKEKIYKLPMGPWAADNNLRVVGLYHREQFLDGIQGIILKYLTQIKGWTPEEVDVFIADVKTQIMDKNIHCYWKVYNITGQKSGA